MQRNRLFNLLRNNAKRGSIVAEGNVIYLYDFIAGSESDAEWWGGISAEAFTKLITAMEGPVSVRIDSPGGDVFGGRAIAQAIREYSGEVTAHIDGLAASAASFIAIAADKVVAAPGSFVMIHRAWTLALGNCNDMRASADVLDKIDGTLADSYAAKAGGEPADWLVQMDGETWFTAKEAHAAGLVDEVAPERAEKTSNAVARAKWDLSAFEHAPEITPEPEPQVEPEAAAEVEADPDPEPEPVETGNDDEIAARQRRLTVALLQRTA